MPGQHRTGTRRVAALTLGGLLLLLLVGRLTSHGLTPHPPTQQAPQAPSTAPAVATTTPPGMTTIVDNLGAGARQLAVGPGGVWVALWDDGQLVRVDPTRRRVVARIHVGRPQEGPLGVATGFGAVWVTNYRDGTLLRIDPAGNRVAARIPIGPVGSVTSGAGAVWVTSGEAGPDGTLTRVDPRRNRVAARIRVPRAAQLWDVAAAGRWVWLADVYGRLWRVDVASHRLVKLRLFVHWASTQMGPGSLLASDGMVWAGGDLELLRLDPATGRLVARVAWQGRAGQGFAAGGTVGVLGAGAAWFSSPQGVARIDPQRNRVSGMLAFTGGITGLASAGGVLWVLSGSSLVRIDPSSAVTTLP